MERDQALHELSALREFIDFINKQVGVYVDSLAGFDGNKVRAERQTARILRQSSSKIENGRSVMMWVSAEDPSSPDVLHHRIIRSNDFIDQNREAGFNEQQLCRGILVFIFAYWDEEIRPRIAASRNVKPNEIKLDAFGDLRLLRKSIVHNGGRISETDYEKLKVMKDLCSPNSPIAPTHDQMHKIFVNLKNGIGRLILDHFGDLQGAPNPDEVVDVAIQNVLRGE